MNEALSSIWDGLNPHLVASFWAVDRKGNRLDDITVKAPLIEADLEATLNWQSQFEQTAQNIAPTLQQLIQSGELGPGLDRLDSALGTDLAAMASKFEGKTSITKLNSTQVFNGMPPVKIQLSALFRAWRDTVKEVENPFNQLMAWALPIKLEKDGLLLSRLADLDAGATEAVFPSKAPTMIAMLYKGRTYKPLVIESIGQPLSSPIDKQGNFVELTVPMTLATLTAIDRQDWIDFNKKR